MVTKLDTLFLLNCDETFTIEDSYPEYVKHLKNGNWVAILKNPILNSFLKSGFERDLIEKLLGNEVLSDNYYEILAIFVACIGKFCEINWIGPESEMHVFEYWPKNINAMEYLALNGEEINPTILSIELFLIALKLSEILPSNLVCTWWKLRLYLIYQKILEELSSTILNALENITKSMLCYEKELGNSISKILLNLELSQVHLIYGKIQDSERYIQNAEKLSQFKIELKGALGKRTKFQQKAVAQLNLSVTFDNSTNRIPSFQSHPNSHLLSPLKLDDDLLLENIQFLDVGENISTELTAVEQLICLNSIQYLQRSQPKDELADEELFPYIKLLLAQKYGPWAVRVFALLIKTKLESNNKRTVERAMMQCEEIVKNFHALTPTIVNRLSYLWATGLPFSVNWCSQLADLMLSIGLVKAALDLYLKLQLWEEVIACYTILDLRHKAAEIIQQQINVKPTIKLYCLLGDATDDINMYEKAWNFSQQKSSRAQRHWGNFLFSQKKYAECIPHYQKSCEINSLQESVWLRLGYAALSVENWEISATAYRRYTYLEPNSFEAWNNLGKVYVKQGNKERAYKALNEALKYNYDNWQVWENMLIVSLDTGHFDDVIRSYHRILDLRGKHLDIEVLTVLVSAIIRNSVDAEGNTADRLKPKLLTLFGRISVIHSNDHNLWQLYADISPNLLTKCQRLIKSYNSMIQMSNWGIDSHTCEKVCNLAESLALNVLELKVNKDDPNRNQAIETLSSARLTVQSIIRVLQKEKLSQYDDKIALLQSHLNDLTTELKTLMSN